MVARLILALVLVATLCCVEAQIIIPAPLSTKANNYACGCTKMCISSPANCDPLVTSGCFFGSVQRTSTQYLQVEISGLTSGYVGLGIAPDSPNKDQSILFVCSTNISSAYYAASISSRPSVSFIDDAAAQNAQTALSGRENIATMIHCSFLTTISSISPYSNNPTANFTYLPFIMTIVTGTTSGFQLGSPTRVYNSVTALNMMEPKSNGPCNTTAYSQIQSFSSSGSSSSSTNSAVSLGVHGSDQIHTLIRFS
ncbi:putative ferric-chelate reductase 1 isoform X2 [Trichomycterus rosablanca]|uniref:putative ferric-chelate reductase 1 isoform X2 n=1 Tax=Trichomycterus rosablanca TaxID=2290929 RepID=UPI002F35DDC0